MKAYMVGAAVAVAAALIGIAVFHGSAVADSARVVSEASARAEVSIGWRRSHNGRYVAEVVSASAMTEGSTGTWVVHVEDRRGRRVSGADVDVTVVSPESGERIEQAPTARYVGHGNYRIEGVALPHAGWWNVALVISARAGTDSVAFNVVLPKRIEKQQDETQAVIAVVGESKGTQISDFLIPRALLTGLGGARVVTTAATSAAIQLTPGNLSLRPDLTFADFDKHYPGGATYVIVPQLRDSENATVAAWLRKQAERGAAIVSICDGAWTVANAGLFDGRRATAHWHSLPQLAKKYPSTTWVRDERYVTDERVISTTGVTAALPASVYLIERIAGRTAADSAAASLGLSSWDTQHATDAFALSKGRYTKALLNHFAWWRHDVVSVPVQDGVDEIALAHTVDAIPRTMRGEVHVIAETETIVGKRGVTLMVDRNNAPLSDKVLRIPSAPAYPAVALDSAIAHLEAWYGKDAGELIAIGMEYPRPSRRSTTATATARKNQ